MSVEQKFYDDPKYRSYASQIEKALKNFEYSTEWADLISALVKLNKVLQGNTSFAFLPKRITIGKRLSQCLHPALPGGVHIKALEVYDTIFKIIGKKRLEMDLHIFGSGIFSLLANASMQVRPVLLNVYETHLLPLGEKLRASMDGMLLGLLPGLEEGSEHFDRISLLLDKISKSVDRQYFYSSLWRCVLSSPSASIVRLAAMQLVLRQFDKKKMTDDQLYLIGLDVDVMVHALCEALQDENVLTQRATLDVLGYCFPLSSLPVSRSDAQQILSSAVYILLRRDMSLNRRLYSWLLGTDVGKSSSGTSVKKTILQYFEENSRNVLISAIRDMINKHIAAFDSACCVATLHALSGSEVKLIRIIISLLDKSEIGPVILNEIFDGILRLVEHVSKKYKIVLSTDMKCKTCTHTHAAKESCMRAQAEFIKSVNLFVSTFETDYMWNVLAENFTTACDGIEKLDQARDNGCEPAFSSFTIPEVCSVIDTMIDIVSMETYVEIQTVHLPELLNRIFTDLGKNCWNFSAEELATCLKLSIEILKHIQPTPPSTIRNKEVDRKNEVGFCVQSFKKFIVILVKSKIIQEENGSVDNFVLDFEKKTQPHLAIPSGYDIFFKFPPAIMRKNHVRFKSHDECNEVMLRAFQDSCKLLVDICCFPTFSQPHAEEKASENDAMNVLPEWLLCLIACACCRDFGKDSILPISQENLDYFYAVRMTACSTVLELMAVTITTYEKVGTNKGTSPDRSVVSVVVSPPLILSHIEWIFEKSDFYEEVCEILWSDLDLTSRVSDSSLKTWSCSRLLILLHQLCPDDTVERLLLQDVLSANVNLRVKAIKKFAKFWHHTKDGSLNHKSNKKFSRCLFAVLDQLTIDRYTFFPDVISSTDDEIGQALISTMVSVWLRQALDEGDLGRILEPYILICLDGRTHRKSLQNFLEYRRGDENPGPISAFVEKHQKDLSESMCQNCAEVQKDIADDSSIWSKYQNFSVDSVLTFALCEVHQQIAKERHSYEHLVALLTLSDEIESPARNASTSTEDEVNTWVIGFVNMVITQGLNLYKSQLETSGEHSFLSGKFEENSEDIIVAKERDYLSDESTVSRAAEAIELNESFMTSENPLYHHILIYQENFDANCILYGLQGILNMASVHPSVFVYAACTTSLASSESVYSNLVQELLVRHERSIEQGRSFYEATSPSSKGAMKNRMLVEVLISICLYYLRSAFYDNSEDTNVNHEIHCIASKLLKFLIKELTNLAQQDEASSKGPKLPSSMKQFSAYIILVLQRQQVQSVVLTCILTTIFALKNHSKSTDDSRSVSTISGTEIASNVDEEAFQFSRSDHLVARYLGADLLQVTTMFSHFLDLIFDLITLEHYAFSKERVTPSQKVIESTSPSIAMNKKYPFPPKPKLKRSQRLFSHLLSASHQYDSDLPLASQKVFVSTILEIYRLETMLELHQECSICLHSSLPYLGSALSATAVPVLLQQCLNLDNTSKLIVTKSIAIIPPGYLECTIKSIVTLTHYCLLTETSSKNTDRGNSDPTQADAISLNSTKTNQSLTGGSSIGSGLSTLLSVFNNSNSAKSATISNEAERSDSLFAAKIAILNNLARIVSCMCVLWRDIVSVEDGGKLPPEEIKGVSYTILQLLGPLAIRYGEYLLVAFSLVWQDRESENGGEKKKSHSLERFLKANPQLERIIDFMMAIKLLSTEMFFSLVKQVMKSPPPTTNEHNDITLQESILQMLLCYMKRLKPGMLMENWSGFLSILQETLSMGAAPNNPNTLSQLSPISPNCYFMLLYLLSEYVKRVTAFSQKKEQRELQEMVTKCIEACNTIAGSSLEQGTWIRRNVSVLPGPQAPEGSNKTHRKTESQSSLDLTDLPPDSPTEPPLHTSSSDTMVTAINHKTLLEVNGIDDPRPESARERPNTLPQISKAILNPLNFRNSVKALTVLSEVVANLLDVVYSSEEKDKVIPILVLIMNNVTPYLRNHGKDNTPSFSACISFLASISGFQYTRRAWRKDVIDSFLDASFFHMPQECVDGWKTIIDNLMTHDKTTFKEVMSRTSLSRPGTSTPTLSIFSNKEQELELRALHIKRLAFIVFSSETDQYQKQLPEIQERLAESLRLNNVPGVQCRVFLCFRVLLLRISAHSLTSLWPTIFTELVHAMLQLEQALLPSFPENNHKGKPKSKSSKANSPFSSEDRKSVMTCWLDMYLSACKLLDLSLCLPAHYVPQFQLYKWSFIGDASPGPPPTISMQGNYNPTRPKEEHTEEDNEIPDPTFVPHCVRIQRLFSELFPSRKDKILTIVPQKPLLNITRLKTLDQLQFFFNTITSPSYLLGSLNFSLAARPGLRRSDSNEVSRSLPLVEKNLEKDFMRPML